ncbi:HK97-gp10 family putative phage morphogenesis protein [Enterococcus mediterraneensis]|uniref:HK97-gp10 family putative phage morphogenesis protein n=1 Tax=Enterococcus mediterraneensis TaxID=2364791 RepID=UPI000F070EAB|nr:HK97-gp10 family putative phage morphogenesis protein [Enterococcus mediterraneensis]
MGRSNISVRGVRELEAKLRRNATLSDVKKIVKLNGSEMNKNASRKAPVDTGFLRRSIIFRISDGGFSAGSIAQAEYAPYVEFGTRFMSAQPFMYPSYLAQKQKFLADLGRLMK